jgi:hypothetical protein
MASQRKRRRREERLEEEEEQGREPVQEKEREATPADRVLELQKTAGNRATTAALSRWGFPWFPATAAPQWPKEPQVILDGQVIPLQSWSWSVNSPGTGGTGTGKAHFDAVQVTTAIGRHSSDLALKTATGQPIKTVIIVVPRKDGTGMTLLFTDVLIMSYSLTGDTESWSLSFRTKEFSQSPPPAQP